MFRRHSVFFVSADGAIFFIVSLLKVNSYFKGSWWFCRALTLAIWPQLHRRHALCCWRKAREEVQI